MESTRDTWSGRMSQAPLAQTKAETLPQFSKKRSGSSNRKPPPISVPAKGWPTSGCLVGDEWSIAWRVLDSQFFGVPQRRRRIALVSDFRGQSAPEILFERKSVQGDLSESRTEGEGFAGTVEESSGRTSYAVRIRGGCNGGGKGALVQTEVSGTLGTHNDQTIFCLSDQGGSVMSVSENVSATLRAQEHGHQPCVLDITHANDVVRDCGETVPTLQSRMGTGGNQVPLVYGVGNGQTNQSLTAEQVGALNCMHDQQAIMTNAIVRRLTPLECERLQGYPDGWTDIGTWMDDNGKSHESSDTARYKALGNSIALPPWKWVLERLCAQFGRKATLASLFDGIGGFPLLWENINGEGSCIWASEIEPFPMAVTKLRFGES